MQKLTLSVTPENHAALTNAVKAHWPDAEPCTSQHMIMAWKLEKTTAINRTLGISANNVHITAGANGALEATLPDLTLSYVHIIGGSYVNQEEKMGIDLNDILSPDDFAQVLTELTTTIDLKKVA